MARGGYREKSGRKSSWISGCSIDETKLVRVPSKIADLVLKAAHDIDAGYILEKVNLIKDSDNQDMINRAKLVLNDLKKINKGRDVAASRRAFAMFLDIDEQLLK